MFLLLQELYASLECVYHVSEQVFRMSQVYTEGGLAPARGLTCYSSDHRYKHPGRVP
jgi:hypothetical protein